MMATISICDICDTVLADYRRGQTLYTVAPKWDEDVLQGLDRLADTVLGIKLRYEDGGSPSANDARTAAMAMMLMSSYAAGAPLNAYTIVQCFDFYERGEVALPMMATRPVVHELYVCMTGSRSCRQGV